MCDLPQLDEHMEEDALLHTYLIMAIIGLFFCSRHFIKGIKCII